MEKHTATNTPPFDETSAASAASAIIAPILPEQEEEFKNPVVRTEYEIFCVCSDVKSLTNKFDKNDGIEAFFTQQAVDELNLASVRLASIVATISTRKLVN